MAIPALKQVVESRSQGSAGFSMEGGNCTDKFYQVAPTTQQIYQTITLILGSCAVNTFGGLKRLLPMRHPQWSWLLAERITDVRGMGTPTLVEAQDANSPEGSLLVSTYALYPVYEYTISFTPRMYPVLPDSDLEEMTASVFTTAGSGTSITYFEEWKRFCEPEILPAPEYISAQQGQMTFRTDSNDPPDGYSFMGFPRILLPKGSLKLKWHQVPYSFVESSDSYLISQLCTVNQREFRGYAPGQLLYAGFTAKRYTPPVPPSTQLGSESFSLFKLCDIEMIFQYRRTTQADVPAVTNNSWVASGHNLEPWLGTAGAGRGYYYATDGDSAAVDTLWRPKFDSGHFELLFRDPDNG